MKDLNTKEYWDKYWQEVFIDRPLIHSIPVEIMRNIGEAGASILDIGCGDGHFDLAIKEQLNADILGIDFSSVAVEMCSQRGIKAECIEFKELKDRKFDYVISSNFIEHLPEFPNLDHLAIKKVIHVISTARKESHLKTYSLDRLKKHGGKAYSFHVPEWEEEQILWTNC